MQFRDETAEYREQVHRLLALVLVLWVIPAAAQTPGDSTPAPPAGTSPAFVVQSDNGDNRLQLGVVVQADARFAVDDTEHQVLDTFTLRRFRGIAQGRVARYFDFYVNVDFAGGIVNVRDAYFDTILSPAFRVRVGKAKAPFSYDRNILVVNTLFGERGLTTTVAPDRDIGVQLLGDLADARLSYAVAFTNGVVDGGSADGDSNEAKDVTARIIARPWTRSARHPLSGLGLSVAVNTGTHGPALPSFVSAGRQTFFSYAGAADSGRRSRWSPQAFYYRGPFGAYSEYRAVDGRDREGRRGRGDRPRGLAGGGLVGADRGNGRREKRASSRELRSARRPLRCSAGDRARRASGREPRCRQPRPDRARRQPDGRRVDRWSQLVSQPLREVALRLHPDGLRR